MVDAMARILLIDDAEYANDLMQLILVAGGHEIVGKARDGYEGIEKYRQLNPDLVILDVIMPRMGGMECLNTIRHINPEAKILVVSADGQEEHIKRLVREGAMGYIIKPYKKDVVLAEIQTIMGGP
ncbi:MAG TPA: response regulator [Methanoregulaceae archaeon]|nr:response regulator [Methanoregulaceae archaeon]